MIHHAGTATSAILAVAIPVVLAGLHALAVLRARTPAATTAPLVAARTRAVGVAAEAGLVHVEECPAPTAPDLLGCVVHRSGGEELDGDAELRENDLVDRTLHRRARHRGLGRQPGPSLFPPPHRYAVSPRSANSRPTPSERLGFRLPSTLPNLPPVDGFVDELREAIAWWLEPVLAAPALQPMPAAKGTAEPRVFFPTRRWNDRASSLDAVRYAARNRVLVEFHYKGAVRVVEPYSIRHPATGSVLLHAWEVTKNGAPTNAHRSYELAGISDVSATSTSFAARWIVEL